jgi:acetyl esterase/lipase
MRRTFLILSVLVAAIAPAFAQQNGGQQTVPENAPSRSLQLRYHPTPRPDPGTGQQQAASKIQNNPPSQTPPSSRVDGATPTPRPNPAGARKNFPDGVNAVFGIVYAPGSSNLLTLDLYRPLPRNYLLPLVVVVSDGIDSHHAAVFPDLPGTIAGLAARGYVVAVVNYRDSAQARFPAAVQDIKAAIRFLRGHVGEMDFDTTRVALWGIAGGGQLAALTGVSCGVPLFGPGDNDCVQAVVDWYGPVEAPIACDAGCAPGQEKTGFPLSYVAVTSPPFLIEQGADDPVAPQSKRLQAALQAANVNVDVQVFPGVGRDFAANGVHDAGVTHQALQKVEVFLAGIFPPIAIGGKAKASGHGSVH